MKEFRADMLDWFNRGRRFATARVIETIGSAPLPVGATQIVGPDGQVYGGVSAGCVESSVMIAAQESIEDGKRRLGTFGVADETAFAAGLMCGGTIRVLVESIDRQSHPWLPRFLSAIGGGAPCAIWSELPAEGSAEPMGEWLVGRGESGFIQEGSPTTAPSTPQVEQVVRDARELLLFARSEIREYCVGAGSDLGIGAVFVHTYARAPQLVIVGAVDFARALSTLGAQLGYETVVCDARPQFANPQRFPDASRVACQRPDQFLASASLDARAVVCVLTHDPRFDVPALLAALDTDAGYIGAMGSRSTHLDRSARLIESGVKKTDIQRIHSPIGLDIGGRTAEQTAVSIMAEVIACASGRSGVPLGAVGVPIH